MISGGSEHTLARAIMEHFHPTTFPESLKATLNCYQLSSIDSLSGPSGFPALAAQMWFKENKQLPPIPPQPMVQIPYFIPNDKSAKRSETCLAGEKIACFIVGGEKRLCLPQILTSVLREYSIAEINQACADLHIYCSRCLPKQLETLKVLGILPINTAQCGLITKTDAERLVALLTDQHEPVKSHRDRLPKHIDPDSGIEVYHECFGRGYGKIYPELYNSPIAPCIVCEGCGCMYSPQRFITHSHRSFEKRTCHWGFDPDSWRNYLLLPKDLEGAKREEYQKILDQVKSRFEQRYDVPSHPPVRYSGGSPTPSKRRYDSEQESPIRKKIKEEDTKIFDPALLPHPYASLQYGVPSAMRHSAFRPWSPGLATAMSGGPNPGDIPVVQEIPQHLKGLLPITFDRRGFSQFIQNERPVVIGSSSRASDFPIAPPDGRPVPSIGIPPSSERKKSADNEKSNPAKICLKSPSRDPAAEKDKNNNHCADPVSGLSNRNLPKVSMTRKYSIDRSPHERPRKLSTSPSRHHPNVAEVRPRSRQRHTSPVPYREQIPVTPNSSQRAPTTSTSYSHSSNNNNMLLKEPKEEYEIARPISRSREAAATAMLELKSSGLYRSVAPPPPLARHSPPPTPVSETQTKVVSTSRSVPSIVPLDSTKQQYKWMIAGHSYVISAAGIQSLEATRSIVGSECGNEAARNRIMHEFVKMKSLFEEKFDIEMRVRRDLELELEHLKASKREKIQATSEKRKQINEEMDIMRQEHSRRMKELSKSQEMFLSKLKDQGRDSGVASAIKNDQDLRARIHELEMKNDKLRLDLMDEREKRTDAELKQKEATESSRGRISFLLQSPLSRMVRGVAGRKAADEESSITSSCTNKNISSTQVPSFPSVSSITSTSSHQRQLNGILSPTAPPVNCLPHEQSINSDVESQKPVIVS